MNQTIKIASLLFLCMVLGVVPAISAAEPPSDPLVRANTAFAVDLYDLLKNSEGNLFFSPYSISTALAMTYAGARGQTAKQMAATMCFPPVQERLHAGFSELQTELNRVQEAGDVQLFIANSLWPHVAYPLKSQFLELVETDYRASIAPLDYVKQTENSRKTINLWVEEKTRNKIKDLIKPGVLNASTRLVLANAIYFKGNWVSQFNKDLTREMPFYLSASKTVSTPMMTQEKQFGYYADTDLQVLEMPYAGDRISMLAILPAKADGINELEETLSVAKLNQWIAGLENTRVQIWFPRFKMTSEFDLGDTLETLGMADAFSPVDANFSGMDGTRNLHISTVIHKAFVEVNEEGTEAAAATAIGIKTTALALPPPQFLADHPFMFFIRDRKTGSILFMGRVASPAPVSENAPAPVEPEGKEE